MTGKLRGHSTAIRFVCGLAACLFAAGALLAEGYGPNTIAGKVTGPGGRFVENIEVILQNLSGYAVDSVYTNAQGEFTFRGVDNGLYHVIVNDSRYQKAEVRANVTSPLEPIARVFLSLDPRGGSSSSSPPHYTTGAHTVSVQELKAKFPDKAVKEYTKGNTKMERGDTQGAIVAFKKALAVAPGMYPALNNLGTAYLQGGQLAEAEETFRKALDADASSADLYVNLGHVYFEMRKYDQAAAALSSGLTRDPNNAFAYFFLGMTDLRIGKTIEGEVNLKKALDLNEPEVATAHLALANLYLAAHREPLARKHLESFLKVRPQDSQADHVRAVLTRLTAEDSK
jgi:tetratricopeptide (TPR) repeat protein